MLATTERGASPELAAKWMINELPRALEGKELGDEVLDAARFAAFLAKLESGELSSSIAKQALADMIRTGKTIDEVAAPALSDADVAAEVDRVVAAHGDKAEQLRGGKMGLVGFFVGQVMRSAPGADPKEVTRVLRERLGLG